jgi:hypothetical protein
MKSFAMAIFSILLILCFLPSVSYSQSFEGEITMKITNSNDEEPQTINYYCKGSKIRFEGTGKEGMGGAMILDTKNNNSIIIIPAQKMYMSYSFKNKMGTMSDSMRNKLEKGDVKMTGETKEINGFNCEKWIFKDDEGKSGEAWMTKGLRNFFFFNNPMKPRGDEPEWAKKLFTEGYFPMLLTSRDSDGKIESKMEVTSVQPRALDESLFTPPPDYKEMKMPMMMNQGN